jgi:hypothetical protein
MGMKIKFNVPALEASIHNIAEKASSNAARSLRRAAVKIRDLAREYAPRDTGTLENSIDYGTTTGADKRKVFVVYIDLDAMHPAGKPVGDYAWIMEQQLHPHGRRAPGGLDFHTRAKSGPKVGGRFLSRAIKEGTKMMLENARTEVSRTLGKSRLINIDYQRDTGGDE